MGILLFAWLADFEPPRPTGPPALDRRLPLELHVQKLDSRRPGHEVSLQVDPSGHHQRVDTLKDDSVTRGSGTELKRLLDVLSGLLEAPESQQGGPDTLLTVRMPGRMSQRVIGFDPTPDGRFVLNHPLLRR
ncbi:MAG: hypothetical protein AB1758_25950 [Candidatus Eremiobacterota bacterium]